MVATREPDRAHAEVRRRVHPDQPERARGQGQAEVISPALPRTR